MEEGIKQVLLHISNELLNKDLTAMIFLCGKELSEREKENISDGMKLFSIMMKKGLLSKDNLLFLKELLSRIRRKDILAEILKTEKAEIEKLERSFQHVSLYRSLLYNISVSLKIEETEKIMFLLENSNDENKCMMMILTEMEKRDLLSKDNLDELNKILLKINRKDLSNKIKKFENEPDITDNNQRQSLETEFEKIALQESGSDKGESSIQQDTQNNSSAMNDQLEEYKLDKSPHGLCVIVNNRNFSDTKVDRKGTEKDAEAIKNVFLSRDYEVMQHDDLTSDSMQTTIKTYAKQDHTKKDSFVCFVLSHGDKGTVLGTDGKKVPVKDLTDQFNGLKCPSLIGKPKIFFFQACQGHQSDKGVSYVSDNDMTIYVTDASGERIPVTADFLTAYASVGGYESYRCPETGSVYIQNLCKALQQPQFYKVDLTRILTKVNGMTASGNYEVEKRQCVKQMPTFHSELRKVLILPTPSNGQQATL